MCCTPNGSESRPSTSSSDAFSILPFSIANFVTTSRKDKVTENILAKSTVSLQDTFPNVKIFILACKSEDISRRVVLSIVPCAEICAALTSAVQMKPATNRTSRYKVVREELRITIQHFSMYTSLFSLSSSSSSVLLLMFIEESASSSRRL